jgi:hypothetical protein
MGKPSEDRLELKVGKSCIGMYTREVVKVMMMILSILHLAYINTSYFTQFLHLCEVVAILISIK